MTALVFQVSVSQRTSTAGHSTDAQPRRSALGRHNTPVDLLCQLPQLAAPAQTGNAPDSALQVRVLPLVLQCTSVMQNAASALLRLLWIALKE